MLKPMFDDVKSPFKKNGDKTNTANTDNPIHVGGDVSKPHISATLPDISVPKSGKRKLRDIRKPLLIVTGLILLVVGGGAAFLATRSKPTPVVSSTAVKETPAPAPTTVAARLSGVQVAPELDKRAVRAFMIENSPDARPQSGLKDAEVVYEAVAEGGITRFLALFQVNQPSYIGPVRSARPYYLDWLLPFDSALGHAGGSPDALNQIKALQIKDLDQFKNSASYMRVTSRFAPHNLYTSMDKINALMNAKGYTTSTFTGFTRKAEAANQTPNVKSIDFSISSFFYNVHYDYDAATNSYKRYEGGKPHTDEKSGIQIAPKVVIALVMKKGIASDRLHSTYVTTGSGPMYVFQDGILTTGTWSKAERHQQFVFTDATGKPLALNPGQTWLSVVDSTSKVTYK